MKKAISLGNPSWNEAYDAGLLNIPVKHLESPYLETISGHKFINMCSCSYLGLDTHPEIVKGAANAVLKAGTINLPTSRVRIRLSMLDEAEEELSQLFNGIARTTVSCSAGTSGILPVLASGILTDNKKPVMAFDKFSHFSINHIKPICGDETEVVTCPHNDLNFIEDLCKKNPVVAYIADGAYSMGGCAPVKELEELQNKYGLFLYFDDSHSISAYGKHGIGYVRSALDELTERTIIVGSLAKGFGACGGIVLYGAHKNIPIVDRFGGPMSWSQYINPAGIGAIQASIKIHKSDKLEQLQQKLKLNVDYFDKNIKTIDAGNDLPIRVVQVGEPSKAVKFSEEVFANGFYTSAVFFPIVQKGTAGLRVMPRADMSSENIAEFCRTVSSLLEKNKSGGVQG